MRKTQAPIEPAGKFTKPGTLALTGGDPRNFAIIWALCGLSQVELVMRNFRVEILLASTVLAIAAGAPITHEAAAQTIVRTLPPPPASIHDRPQRHIIQVPPSQRPRAAAPQKPATEAQAQTEPPAPVQAAPPAAEPPAPAPQTAESGGGIDIKGTLDRLLAASDSQITDRLRAIVAGKQLDKAMPRQAERAAAETFYKSRNYAPIWIKDGLLTARAKGVMARLKNAAADGLDAADYPVPEFGTFTGAEALAEGDITLTNSVLDYARHLSVGRIAPTRVSAEVDYGKHTPDPAAILRELASSSDVNATLEGYNPPHEGFKALKAKLAALRSNASAEPADSGRIPDGPVVHVGSKDARVPQLREKLGLRSNKPDDSTYDVKLAKLVQQVQIRNGLQARGQLDNRTIAAINGPKLSNPTEAVIANMERWRWLPRDLGRNYVMVNVPDYTLKVVKDGSVVWRTKIVAGKPQTPTPLTSAYMQTIVVNPSWYVPQSIIQNELLPQYDQDPHIFERLGLEVKRGPDGNINVVQPPGAANALGRIKFNFPNKFQVYLHDTPEKKLFTYERRAFSHGCMRVEDPTKFGEVMLSMAMAGPTPSSPQLLQMFGHEERTFTLQTQPKVHLTYQTAFVDDSGRLIQREDLYGFDARIRAILSSDERKVADVPPPQDPKRDLATFKSNQEILRRVERREASNPFQFFERIFR
jgi:murein L,D-transpeptidase YcbB/YkuD